MMLKTEVSPEPGEEDKSYFRAEEDSAPGGKTTAMKEQEEL